RFAKFIYEEYDFLPFVNQRFVASKPFSAAFLTWAEIGGTYGRVWLNKSVHYLKWAATVNLLGGFDGLYLDGRKLDFTVLDSSTAIIHNLDATIGHALDANGNAGAGSFLTFRGWGLSTTLGLTYVHRRDRGGYDCNKTSDNHKKYQYRAGLSLMDFGFIHFSKHAQVIELKTSTSPGWSRLVTVKFTSF